MTSRRQSEYDAARQRRVAIEHDRRLRNPQEPPTRLQWRGRGETPWRFAQLTTPLYTSDSTSAPTGAAKGSAKAYALVRNSDNTAWTYDPATIDAFGNGLLTVYAPPLMLASDVMGAGYAIKIEWLADAVQPGWYVTAAQCAMAAAQ
jgi:hypothetical protein